VISVEKKTTF